MHTTCSIHRSWLVCLGGALGLFAVMGLGVNVFSIYQPYLITELSLTNAQASLITTVRSLFAILSMLAVSKVVDRLGLRVTMGVGMACAVLSCLVFGLASNFSACCLGATLAGIGYALAGMIPLSYTVARWFHIRRGYALGLASASSGMATVIAPSPITYSLQHFGLSATFFLEAGAMLLLGILLVILVRNSPEALGLTPYGADSVQESQAVEKTTAVPSSVWYLVMLVAFLSGAAGGTGFSHLTVLYASEGFSETQITLLFSYLGFMAMISKAVYGQLSDLLGGFRSNFMLFSATLAGLVFCCFAPTGNMVLAVSAMTGTAVSLSLSVAVSTWTFDLSTSQQYEKRMRQLSVSFMVGNLCFGPTPGLIADATGSYVPAYVVFTATTLLGLIIIQSIYIRFRDVVSG